VGILGTDDYTDIVKPYYSFFLEHGVLHYNLESLVRHLNSISIEDWWRTVQQHEMYNDYRNLFTRAV
jgi:hypothetical protein